MNRTVETVDVQLLAPAAPTGRPADPEAYALETALRALVQLGAANLPRSRQQAVGMSDIGRPCDRRLAFKLAGTAPVNPADPLRSLVGIGTHAVLADAFRGLDAHSGRFLVEQRLTYRGVPGTCDLYDRITGTVIDWKTALRTKLSKIRADGPPREYVTQVQMYGAALTTMGEDVRAVALAYLPIDAGLVDMWVWRTDFDCRAADAAVDRLNTIAAANGGHREVSQVETSPGPICKWCDFYHPQATDLNVACPAKGI